MIGLTTIDKEEKQAKLNRAKSKAEPEENHVPYTREHFQMWRNPYSNFWTRSSDEWNLTEAFHILVKVWSEIKEDEFAYHTALLQIHNGLRELAVEIGISEEALVEMYSLQPRTAPMYDNGKVFRVNTYWHLPDGKRDPFTEMYLQAQKLDHADSRLEDKANMLGTNK